MNLKMLLKTRLMIFNEDTCDVSAYNFWFYKDLLTHKHSHDIINYDNDDKTVDVEIVVKSENATENNVEVEELFEDDKSQQTLTWRCCSWQGVQFWWGVFR